MAQENNTWSTAKKYLAPHGIFTRVENPLMAGFPDVVYCVRGCAGLLETKATIGEVRLEQVLYAEGWAHNNGLYHMLLRADNVWALFDATGTRALLIPHTNSHDVALVWKIGPFPTAEILRHLAPPESRILRIH